MKKRSSLILVGTAAGALMLGTIGGAAVATVPRLLAPAGLSAEAGVDTEPMPAPSYAVNEAGETYGSAADAPSPELEPALIVAQATNGKVGYVRKADLDRVDGTSAMSTFKSPEEALSWQRENAGKSYTVPVYQKDGKTVIGEFLITPPRAAA